MPNTNCNDGRLLGLLAASERGIAQDEYETTCEECRSFLEPLSVGALSEGDTRRLASHLVECPACREMCSELWRAGVYADLPLGYRMRKFEKDPENETDENWRQIAITFNPELALLAWRIRRVALRDKARRFLSRFLSDIKEKIAECVAVVEGTCRPAPVRAAFDFDSVFVNSPKPACDGVKGLTLKSRKNRIMYVASAAIILVAVGIFGSTPNNPEPTPGGPRGITKDGGATAEVTNVEPYLVILEFDFGNENIVYQTGRGYFAQGEYSKAASDFRSLVDKLEGENVGGEALVVARWNLAVALIKSGKPEEAASVLETLRQTNLDDPKMKEGVTTLLNELNK